VRTIQGVKTTEVVYSVTSLPPEWADAATLLRLVPDYWAIGNELPYVRDVTLREDACRERSSRPRCPPERGLLDGIDCSSTTEAIEVLQLQPNEHGNRSASPAINNGAAAEDSARFGRWC
jgi:hypothetical protein